jgi:nucleoside-diphosphate-sugar epimerase
MKVLVTGAFGNIGRSTIEELIGQGHTVRCFDIKTRANEKAARQLNGQVEVVWGDLRSPDDIAAAVRGQDAVIHLAFIIPKLSATGFESEDHPDWAREINVGGTRNLVEAMAAQSKSPRLLFASSYHIYGRTHHMPPPRTVDDPPRPVEHYACHKVEAESLIRASELEWAIFRLAAALPLSMKMDPGMFDVPLENRMEYVHTRDVGLAFANAVSNPDVWGKTLHIGGGPRCQYIYREITEKVLDGMGVGSLPDEAFTSTPFPTDWLDTEESQRLLQYQHHTLDDYVADMKKLLGFRRRLVRVFLPLARSWLLRQSPYLRPERSDWLVALVYRIKMLKNPPEAELG